jgi:hypothetical protein
MTELSVTREQILAITATALIRDGFNNWGDIYKTAMADMRSVNQSLKIDNLIDQIDSLESFESWAIESCFNDYIQTNPELKDYHDSAPDWHLNIFLTGWAVGSLNHLNRNSGNYNGDIDVSTRVVGQCINSIQSQLKAQGAL